MYSPRLRRKCLTLRGCAKGRVPPRGAAPRPQEHLGAGASWRAGKQRHCVYLSKCHGDIYRYNHANVICSEKCISKIDASYYLSTWLPQNEAIPFSASQEGVSVLEAWNWDLATKLKEQLTASSWLVECASPLGRAESELEGFGGHKSIPTFQVTPCPDREKKWGFGYKLTALVNPELELNISIGEWKD